MPQQEPPSPNSHDANKDEILEDADDEDAEDSRAPSPPSDPAKVDISKTPHRPRKEYIRLIQNLPQPQRIVAGTTYSTMTGEPKTSPSQVTPKVHKLLQRIHQQNRSPDLSIPLQPHDCQRALLRDLRNSYQDDEDQPDLLSIDESDYILIYFSRLTNTNPYSFFNAPHKAQYIRGTPLTQGWATAVAGLGCHYQSSSHTLIQQSMYSYLSHKSSDSKAKTRVTPAKKHYKPRLKNPSPISPALTSEECPTDCKKPSPKRSTKPPPTPVSASRSVAFDDPDNDSNKSNDSPHPADSGPKASGNFPTDIQRWHDRTLNDDSPIFLYTTTS